MEYEEKESEFDIDDEDKSVEAGPQHEDEDLEVSYYRNYDIYNTKVQLIYCGFLDLCTKKSLKKQLL